MEVKKRIILTRFDSADSDYTEPEKKVGVNGLSIPESPFKITGLELVPDYVFTEKNVCVIITRISLYLEDFSIAKIFFHTYGEMVPGFD